MASAASRMTFRTLLPSMTHRAQPRKMMDKPLGMSARRRNHLRCHAAGELIGATNTPCVAVVSLVTSTFERFRRPLKSRWQCYTRRAGNVREHGSFRRLDLALSSPADASSVFNAAQRRIPSRDPAFPAARLLRFVTAGPPPRPTAISVTKNTHRRASP